MLWFGFSKAPVGLHIAHQAQYIQKDILGLVVSFDFPHGRSMVRIDEQIS